MARYMTAEDAINALDEYFKKDDIIICQAFGKKDVDGNIDDQKWQDFANTYQDQLADWVSQKMTAAWIDWSGNN